MGALSQLLSSAVSGVKTLVKNAQIGKAATASGYVQGVLTPSQQSQTAITSSPNFLVYVFGGVIAIILLFVALFSRKK